MRNLQFPNFFLLATLVLTLSKAYASPLQTETKRSQKCPEVSGSFNISNAGLFPENLDWDSQHCKLYISALLNSTVLVYDPYAKEYEILTFPGISYSPEYHMSGVFYDRRTSFMYFVANAGEPFQTGGHNLSGPNQLIKYDTRRRKVEWMADLAPSQREFLSLTGRNFSGFQDLTTDTKGNAYVVGSWGSGIAKVSPSGVVSLFYADPDVVIENGAPKVAYDGIFSVGDKLVSLARGQIRTFDTNRPKNPFKSSFTPSNAPANWTFICDKIYAPPKYGGKIALCSAFTWPEGYSIVVLESKDNWVSGKILGAWANNSTLQLQSAATASVQIGDGLFVDESAGLTMTFEPMVPLLDKFPIVDITSAVKALVGY